MNISKFDNTQKKEITNYGESIRIANELRSTPAKTIIDTNGNRINVPMKKGFDVENCDFDTIVLYMLNDCKKSMTQLLFLHRILAVRFPDKYANLKRDPLFKNWGSEMELIESEKKNEIEWFGEVGFHNTQFLNKKLITPPRYIHHRF